MDIIKSIFPGMLQKQMEAAFGQLKDVQEIRIRVNQRIFVRTMQKDFYIDREGRVYEIEEPGGRKSNGMMAGRMTAGQNVRIGECCSIISREDMDAIMLHLCKSSRYAYEEEIRNGFLTLEGGHRVGIAGQVVRGEDGKVRTIKMVCFIHVRMAHERRGAAGKLMSLLPKEGIVPNCLIVSPPGFGKTTLLRDFIREVSNGDEKRRYKQCCIIDERGEIAGLYQGVPQLDIGKHTDVYGDCPKTAGLMMAIRAMGPEVIGVDELGNEEDISALQFAIQNGCSIIATIHGTHLADVRKKSFMKKFIGDKIFDRYIVIVNANHEYEVYNGDFEPCFI